MSNPIVSIVVPCYNHGKYLPETLDSVMAQSFKDWECVIVDDGSTDDTEAVALDYCKKDTRFKYIYQENQGAPVACNTGFRSTSGEFILRLDADDLIASSYVEKAVAHFMDFPETSIVCCRGRYFGSYNNPIILPEYSYETLLFNNCFFCSIFFRRSDYDKTDGYNPNMRNGLNDWDFWITLLSPDSIVYCIDEVLFYYRTGGNSIITKNRNAKKQTEELCRQLYFNHKDKYQDYVPNIVYYAMSANNWRDKYEKERLDYDHCRQSRAYKVGKMIVKPFTSIKKLFKR